MSVPKSKQRLIALAMVVCVFCLLFWLSRSGRRQGPFELTFVRVSAGQPVELYYRDHNKLMPAGRSLGWLQGKLQRLGLKVNLVRERTLFSDETNRVCVVMGVDGPPLSSTADAAIMTGSDQIPLEFRTRWTKPGTAKQLAMWQSAPGVEAPKQGVLLVTDPNSGNVLIRHRF